MLPLGVVAIGRAFNVDLGSAVGLYRSFCARKIPLQLLQPHADRETLAGHAESVGGRVRSDQSGGAKSVRVAKGFNDASKYT